MGAGRISVDRAVRAGVTIAETAERFLRFGDDDVRSVDLNLPSINMPVMPGRLAVKRVLRNDTDSTISYAVKVSDRAVSVDQDSIAVPPRATATLWITVASRANDAVWRFGSVTLTPRFGSQPVLHLPIAYRPTQGRITLTSGCDAATVRLGQTATCRVKVENTGYEESDATVTTKFDEALQPLDLAGRRIATLDGIRPGVPSLKDVEGRFYQPLRGAAPPVGDEEIVIYETPAFTYAGQRYERIGVVANGYVILGGGTAQDIRSEPPSKADDERPNNLLAPYWSDLDGTGEEGVRVSTVDRDQRTWIVVEWHVKRYGTEDKTHFQLWIASGENEVARFAYDEKALPSGAFSFGAENALGAGVLRAGAQPSADLLVTSRGFRPGGMLEFTIPVRGGALSASASFTTSMTSQGVPGTTIVRTGLPVVSP
jgi:hypothetical protein